jgi:hypothetical protein
MRAVTSTPATTDPDTGSTNVAKQKTTKTDKPAKAAKAKAAKAAVQTPAPAPQEARPAARATRPAKEAKPKKSSALDAAAKVLAEEGRPMGCQELVEVMAAKGYWSSLKGKTPAATLYTAVTMLPKVA